MWNKVSTFTRNSILIQGVPKITSVFWFGIISQWNKRSTIAFDDFRSSGIKHGKRIWNEFKLFGVYFARHFWRFPRETFSISRRVFSFNCPKVLGLLARTFLFNPFAIVRIELKSWRSNLLFNLLKFLERLWPLLTCHGAFKFDQLY